jgi:hypothetical protein
VAKAAYHVTAPPFPVEPQLMANGMGIEDVHVIPYQIDSGPAKGHKGTVKVPHANFTPDTVKAAIETDVNTNHDVASIGQQ